jgi:hypothetical protein
MICKKNYQFFKNGVVDELENEVQLPLPPEHLDQVDQVLMTKSLKFQLKTTLKTNI